MSKCYFSWAELKGMLLNSNYDKYSRVHSLTLLIFRDCGNPRIIAFRLYQCRATNIWWVQDLTKRFLRWKQLEVINWPVLYKRYIVQVVQKYVLLTCSEDLGFSLFIQATEMDRACSSFCKLELLWKFWSSSGSAGILFQDSKWSWTYKWSFVQH